MQNSVESFLTTVEEQEVVAAICKAEQQTSGEIRVHIETTSKGNIETRALEVFSILNMQNTELHNAVLIYIATNDKAFAIYGDKGIDAVVSNSFWDTTKETIQNHLKNGNRKQALVDGVLLAGQQLKSHFPISKNDRNELSNTISKG
ncbi:TPM domain-containing protein [Lacinutrix jangbogonensis]|uniref:TPM domain-containing protein n=1 Tax=Lacinutrix jangbogonensis TaxID=1469557 RepID=UPI00053E4D6D|nr:TPM domain-containing protein [Lacinutrix jangbogonensis]